MVEIYLRAVNRAKIDKKADIPKTAIRNHILTVITSAAKQAKNGDK